MLRHTLPSLNSTARQDVDVETCRISSSPFVVGSNKARRVTHAENGRRCHSVHEWRHAITRSFPVPPSLPPFETSAYSVNQNFCCATVVCVLSTSTDAYRSATITISAHMARPASPNCLPSAAARPCPRTGRHLARAPSWRCASDPQQRRRRAMKNYRKELCFDIATRVSFQNITTQVEQCFAESSVREGLPADNERHKLLRGSIPSKRPVIPPRRAEASKAT